jgi:hypothetical protein
MLEIKQGEKARRTDFSGAEVLLEHLKCSSAERAAKPPSSGRIYIMEGLALDYIAALGDHFFIDPRFFMDQERTTA